ncbi:carboxypeptidase regulatory-like domain-containing protein [Marinirhabdus gelatinilytica]|uniref:Carboxypeptidase family protein n=1 Tax=Marinirhabdus gelatinilytica TaxID=1703343 RepID=A0A370Q8M5_9FLAO|nr:carboxypeptidase regulatory-like domain-containing protein [Marinirhabdus gelatinilytica]RDK84727.1 carboxypeptidase family protein [Marinirhabdus gelatinilytica]
MKKFLLYSIQVALLSAFLVFQSCEEEGITDNGIGKLTGTVVVDGENSPLANVKISTTPTSNTVFTNDEGFFVIDVINVGDYSVKAELEEYVTAFEPATIIDGETTNVVFELELTAESNVPPSAPILVSPEDNATNVTPPVDFVWTSSDTDTDDIEYIFELRNGSTNEILMSQSLVDTTFTVENLAVGVNYFWQVTATDNVNPSVASDISSFSTAGSVDNRFFYSRIIDGSNVIFSGNDTGGDETPNEDEVQLTQPSTNSFRPKLNRTANKIAFLRTVGPETHLFTMDIDGTNVQQITSSIPVAGFRLDEIEFAWHADGSRIYYPSFNILYSINVFGTDIQEVYVNPEERFITEVDGNEINDLIAIKTNNSAGYEARIVIVDPDTEAEVQVVFEGREGALGGIDYSIDGSTVLFTRDVSEFQIASYRQLDTRIFEFDTATSVITEVSEDKPPGTNDLDARYSPTEGEIIYVNAPNDGVSIGDIYFNVRDENMTDRELLFTQAYMPNWQ